MANLSTSTRASVVNHILRASTWAKPAGVYAAMMSVTGNAAGGGTEIVSGGATRIQVAQLDANWSDPATTGATENAAQILFPTNTGADYTVAGVTFWTASSAGTMMIFGALTTPKLIATGEQFRFNIGDLDFGVS